ncbi:kelch repeat-containing protein [Synoicihabitans lomoniglobus]|uniref:Kelch repeat-containing protein n=1 Tax=Synoicihabitans lomoniglobus TaxID=2909285 RepID=A0AAE9ZXH1_9BACT|nr:hypothetical protein [Opitutaceae bacterium LMO-M01]WED65064.1 kelch repeat-containing protein [Opitutaceae bacterium LMO-M01]
MSVALAVEPDSSKLFQWERWPDLPDPVGLKGMAAGVSNGHVVLAGGSNFPVPPRDGGPKTLATAIYVRAVGANAQTPWRRVPAVLPAGWAEGAAVTTEFGVVALGGLATNGAQAGVFLLGYSPKIRDVTRRLLPDLPVPLASLAAVYSGGVIYVAGGDTGTSASSQFWALNLAAAVDDPKGPHWQSLPSWSGPARFGAVLTALGKADHTRLYLLGGRIKTGRPVSESDYRNDAYRYDPKSNTWEVLPEMPHAVLLGGVLPLDENRLAVVGGSDGHDLDRMAELGARYRIPDRVMVFDTRRDEWELTDPMPLGVVGAPIVPLPNGGWLVVGGEYSPGLRTPRVYEVTVASETTGAFR